MDKVKQDILKDQYEPPKIIAEYELETKAGTPIQGNPDLFTGEDGNPDLGVPNE